MITAKGDDWVVIPQDTKDGEVVVFFPVANIDFVKATPKGEVFVLLKSGVEFSMLVGMDGVETVAAMLVSDAPGIKDYISEWRLRVALSEKEADNVEG